MAVAGVMLLSGCYGPFHLTRKVWDWNGQVSDNRWVVEGVFLVCAWLPVYGIATLADAVLFNSLEFWTGDNPMAPTADADPMTKKLVRGDNEIFLTYGPESLRIDQARSGVAGPSLSIARHGEVTLARDGDGKLLFTAYTLPDGRLVVTDAKTHKSTTHSEQDTRELIASAVK